MYYRSKILFKKVQRLLQDVISDGGRSNLGAEVAVEIRQLLDGNADLLEKTLFMVPDEMFAAQTKDSAARAAVSKAVTEPVTFDSFKNIVVDQSIVTEALILSDLFELNEYNALSLIIEAATGVDRSLFGRHTRGLTAVVLFCKAQNYLVKLLHALISFCVADAQREDDISSECTAEIRSYFNAAFSAGWLTRTLEFLSRWTPRIVFERLEQTKALGLARHRKIVQMTLINTRNLLADIVLEWCNSETVSYVDIKLLLERLCQIDSDIATLDQVDAKLTFAFLASSNLDKERTAEVQGLYANIRNDNAWNNPRLAVVVQMCWAVVFAKTPAQTNLNRTLASIIEGLEDLLDKLVSKDGLYYLAQLLLHIPGMIVTKSYADIMHRVTSNFIIIFMPKLREMVMCSVADRNVPSRRRGEYDAAEACSRLGQLFILMQKVYGVQFAPFDRSVDFWSDIELNERDSEHGGADQQQQQRIVDNAKNDDTAELFKFIRLMCEELGPDLMPMFLKVVACMSQSPRTAHYVHRFLQGRRSRRMSYDAVFLFVSDVLAKFQHQQQLQQQSYALASSFNMPANQQQHRSPAPSIASSSKNAAVVAEALVVTREELALLNASILLIQNLLIHCAASREAICIAHDTQPFLHQLLCCPIPVVLKANVVNCIEALAATSTGSAVQVIKALYIMHVLPAAMPSKGSSSIAAQHQAPQPGGLQLEVEDYEIRQKEYPLTLALMKLARTLVRNMSDFVLLGYLSEQEIGMLHDFVQYLVERVFLSLNLRQYRATYDKYNLVRASLRLIDATLRSLARGGRFSDQGLLGLASWHPGLAIMLDLLRKSMLLSTLLLTIQDCRKILLEDTIIASEDERIVYDMARQTMQILVLVSSRQSEVLDDQQHNNENSSSFLGDSPSSSLQPLAGALQAVALQGFHNTAVSMHSSSAAVAAMMNGSETATTEKQCEALTCVSSFIQFCHEDIELGRTALILFRELVLGAPLYTGDMQTRALIRYYMRNEEEKQDLIAGFYSCINAPGNETAALNNNDDAGRNQPDENNNNNEQQQQPHAADIMPLDCSSEAAANIVLLRLEALRSLTMLLRGGDGTQQSLAGGTSSNVGMNVAHIILGLENVKQQSTSRLALPLGKSRGNVPFSDDVVSIEAEFQYACLASLFAWLARGPETFVANSRTLSLCMDAVVYLLADADTNRFLLSLREMPLQSMDLKLIEYLTLCAEDDKMEVTTFDQQANFQVLLTFLLKHYLMKHDRNALSAIVVRLFSEPPTTTPINGATPEGNGNRQNDAETNENDDDDAKNKFCSTPTALYALLTTLDRIVVEPRSVDSLDLRVISRDYVRQQLAAASVPTTATTTTTSGHKQQKLYDTEWFLRSLIAMYSGSQAVSTWSLEDLQYDFNQISVLLAENAAYMLALSDKRQCFQATLQLLAAVMIACNSSMSSSTTSAAADVQIVPPIQVAAISLDLCNALVARLPECLKLVEVGDLYPTLSILTNTALMLDRTVPPPSNEYARQLEQSSCIFDEILLRDRAALLRLGHASFVGFVQSLVGILVVPSSPRNLSADVAVQTANNNTLSSLALRCAAGQILLNVLKFFSFGIEPAFSDESAVYASDVLEYRVSMASTVDVIRSAAAELHALVLRRGEQICIQIMADMRCAKLDERARYVTLLSRCISMQSHGGGGVGGGVHRWRQLSFKDISEELCVMMRKVDGVVCSLLLPAGSSGSSSAVVADDVAGPGAEAAVAVRALETLYACLSFHVDLVVDVDGGAQFLLFSELFNVLSSLKSLKLILNMPSSSVLLTNRQDAGGAGAVAFRLGGSKQRVREQLTSVYEMVLSLVVLIVQDTSMTAASVRALEKTAVFFGSHSTLLVTRLTELLNDSPPNNNMRSAVTSYGSYSRELHELRLIGDLLSLLPLPQLVDLSSSNAGDGDGRNIQSTIQMQLLQVLELYLVQIGRAATAVSGGASATSATNAVLQQQQYVQRFVPEVPLIKASTFDDEWRLCSDGIMMLANMTSFIKQLCLPAEGQASMAAAVLSANSMQPADATSSNSSTFQPLFILTRSSSNLLLSPHTTTNNKNSSGFPHTKVSLYDIIGLFMLLSNHLCKRTNDVIECNKKMRTLNSSTVDRDVRFAIDSPALDAAAATTTMDSTQMYAVLLKRHVINLLAYCEKNAYALEALLAIICSHLEYFVGIYVREQRKAARFAREHVGKTLRPLFMMVDNDDFELLERLQADVRGEMGKRLIDYMVELSKTILSKSAMLDIYRTKVELLRAQLEEFEKQSRRLEQQWLQQQQQQQIQSPRTQNVGMQSPRIGGGEQPTTKMFKRVQAPQQQGSPLENGRRVLQFR